MKVYISADIEGITGLVSWSQCSRPDGKSYDYPFARRMMTHDVNAAIRGARAAGATEVVVKDSHGNSKNLLIDELEPGTQLVSGYGSATDGMMVGIDETFDAALLVGYHGMAGAHRGIMEHTITGGVHRMWVNGKLCGEIGLSAGVAGRLGVPLVMISSDRVGCEEASELIPGVGTAIVKEGLGRFMGKMLHPSETGPMIEEAARLAVTNRQAIAPYQWDGPTTVRIEFHKAEAADACVEYRATKRVDAYTLVAEFDNFELAHSAIWNMLDVGSAGLDAQW